MQSKVFITGSNVYAAAYFAYVLEANGIRVMSDWHNSPNPLRRSSDITENERKQIANNSIGAIKNSDFVLIIADPDMVPGGKFVDVGVALGAGKKVILVGRRENIKMYHSDILAVDSVAGVLGVLGCEVPTNKATT